MDFGVVIEDGIRSLKRIGERAGASASRLKELTFSVLPSELRNSKTVTGSLTRAGILAVGVVGTVGVGKWVADKMFTDKANAKDQTLEKSAFADDNIKNILNPSVLALLSVTDNFRAASKAASTLAFCALSNGDPRYLVRGLSLASLAGYLNDAKGNVIYDSDSVYRTVIAASEKPLGIIMGMNADAKNETNEDFELIYSDIQSKTIFDFLTRFIKDYASLSEALIPEKS